MMKNADAPSVVERTADLCLRLPRSLGVPPTFALDDVPTSSGEVRVDGRQAFLLLEADPFLLIFRGLALAGGLGFASRS